MFSVAPYSYWHKRPEAILSEVMSAITKKLKFVVCPHYLYKHNALSGLETFVVGYNDWDRVPTLLPEILNKRWQTLDVKSMMSELQRSSSETVIREDTLSSVHRFKRKEGASLS